MDGHDEKVEASEVEVLSGEESQVPQIDQAPAVGLGEAPIVSEPVAEPVEPMATPENNVESPQVEVAPLIQEQPAPVEPIVDIPMTPEPAPAVPEPAVVEMPQEVNKKTEIINVKASEAPTKEYEESPGGDGSSSKEEVVSGEDGASDKEKVISDKESPKVADTVVAPELKRDPMEIARGLDHDVLEAAFRLLAQERSATLLDAKKKSDKKKVDENSDRVEKFVAQYKKGVRRTTIADKLNISPSKVTDYLQRLIASGRVRGEGKTNDRRFYIA
jgi:hypothetical protein